MLQRLTCALWSDPSSGRLSLYLSSHAGGIEGWPVPEARAFLRDLAEHATQRKFVYAHQWKLHDLVMWDNRSTMHRRDPFDGTARRIMHRTQIKGTTRPVAFAA